jgi:flagellar motor switch protein FliN/FliY
LSVIQSQESAWKSYRPLGGSPGESGPIGESSKLTKRQMKIEERLGISGSRIGASSMLKVFADLVGDALKADRFEMHWRAAGLNRPGVTAQLNWPRFATRIGLSIEPALAHALVDRLLGFERFPAEGRYQVTPVEFGILSFVAARALDRLDAKQGPLGPWDLALDRVGPDPFEIHGLGPIVTWKWRIRIGQTTGAARLWIPESVVAFWLLEEPIDTPAVTPLNKPSVDRPSLGSKLEL